ncbi:hypothetical protein BU15DRAFT_68338 [Melanogaster broomeanus]|nr:hypothetical protein BU15DRAFT_68338 [Melanogaster broomeanus]
MTGIVTTKRRVQSPEQQVIVSVLIIYSAYSTSQILLPTPGLAFINASHDVNTHCLKNKCVTSRSVCLNANVLPQMQSHPHRKQVTVDHPHSKHPTLQTLHRPLARTALKRAQLHFAQAVDALNGPSTPRTGHLRFKGPLTLQKGHPHPKRPLTPWTGPDQIINTSNGPVTLQKGRSHPGQATGAPIRPPMARTDHSHSKKVTHAPNGCSRPGQATGAPIRPPTPQTDHSHSKKAAHTLGRPLAPRSDHQHIKWTTCTPKRPLTPWTGLSHPEQTTNTSNGPLALQKGDPCRK